MTVLILARDLDPTADAMVTTLTERGTAVARVNTGWFPARLSVSAGLRGGRWSGHLRTPGQLVSLDDVHAVWYHSPEAYRMPGELSDAERHHAFLEAKYGLGGVLSSLDVVWINHPSRMADAAYKPVQLVRAQQCGLTVPDTLITNEPDPVREFATEPTVTKLVGSNTISEDSTRKISWTRLLDQAELADLRGIETTTHLLQRWVPKAFETRVIAIGEQLFAAAIHAGSASTRVDWRSDYDALTYEPIEPPASVAEGIRALMAGFDLRYGALDFVVTPNGDWVFLEINPGGQYGWLEAATGHPLTRSLADLLSKGIS
ncbi:ATP-grasp ribosomal peptide maturase, SAV_5884 family [Actinopolyspora xinjiangensis]|uniref:ATP-grasp ribosomal peptide maturase, SAV_5884 family n=1 Tax=Actinopolyspora xinjiangensis TaxID=405564 RepID=A0A1H0X2G8_9ACTN|nr:ATP-grasp ribosomal peptide maturase [Actinopolyspora xinjiangensis]SDP97112.1 ATP-grasp ribosomal peptide maturase, SAV_5884 family [Actinopolyspora xinjiangensis]